MGEVDGIRIRTPREDARFRVVRCNHGRKREEAFPQYSDGVLGQQARAGFGEHHRIDDDGDFVERIEILQHRGDRRHGGGVAQHARLDAVHADIGDDRLDLGTDELRRYGMDVVNPDRRLRGQGGHAGQRKSTGGDDRFDVRLDTGAATAVTPGDREDPRIGVERRQHGAHHCGGIGGLREGANGGDTRGAEGANPMRATEVDATEREPRNRRGTRCVGDGREAYRRAARLGGRLPDGAYGGVVGAFRLGGPELFSAA